MRPPYLPLVVLTALLSFCSSAFTQDIRLSEFQASNVSGIRDEDGTRQGWIEIWNSHPTAKFSLNNWKLNYGTPSPVTWTLPNVQLPPGERILIWTSGKNRVVPTAPLHTNFVLTKEPSNLSLVNASGALISDFGAVYPEQLDDVSYGRDPVVVAALGFYTTPTPDAANNFIGSGVAGKVTISEPSGAFSTNLSVTLAEVTPVPGATIRYTLNNTAPTPNSPAYTDPLTVVISTVLRARVFVDGLLPGETETRSFLRLDGSTNSFSSAMPLVVISNFAGGQPPADGDQPGYMWVFNPGADGRARFMTAEGNAVPPDIATRVVMDRRGSSTLNNPKYNLNIESRRNRDENERNIPLLGMPTHSDWVFGAPYNFDRSLLHNPLAFALSNRIGRYATRVREAEVFVDVNGGALAFSGGAGGDYFGVYNVTEKIRRGSKRIDIRRLDPYDNGEFEKTGGYIVKVDRRDSGDGGFTTPHEGLFAYYYPRETVIKVPQRAPQDTYIRNFLTQFDLSMYNVPFNDPVRGYRTYLDVDAAVDHHLVNVWTFNVDALRLSGYMHKERGGKLTYGPVWDFDRSLSSTDGRDANPAVWRSTSADRGTDFFNYTWWNRLFSDIEFYQEYIDRWTEIRRNELSQANVDSLIDSLNAEISAEAVTRDFRRWQQSKRSWTSPFTQVFYPAPGNDPAMGQLAEVQRLKDYLQQRANFMDSQWVNPVTISPDPGNVPPGTMVTMSVANPTGVTIVYTSDGSDPRPAGGGPPDPATSITYDGTPISITATATLRARAYKPSHTALTGASNPPLISRWSGDITARFSTDAPAAAGNLVVTELNYHPTGPTPAEAMAGPGWDEKDFEFIELRNNGAESIDLAGAMFTMGISYTFSGPAARTLNPGDYVIVASNPAAFQQRYGTSLAVAGPWTGDLANEGEQVVLRAVDGSVIVDLTYSDSWHPLTDGGGATLEYIGLAFATADYNDAANWRPSLGIGGSPGSSGLETGGPIVINEILSNSLLPRVDAIELYNPTAAAIDIGGWYLSDVETPSTSESYKKFRIPDGTSVPPGGYVVFTEQDFNPNGAWNPAAGPRGANEFAFDGDHGDSAVLVEADATGNLIRFVDRLEFGAAREDESWGRWPNGTGGLYPMAQQTLLDGGSPLTPWPGAGGENSEPRVGPLLITEVQHAPPGDDANLEFIELHNPTDSDQPLANWRLRGDADFDFTSETVPAGGIVIVTAFAPTDAGLAAAFRTAYGIGDEVPLFGPWQAGDRLESQGRVVLYRAEEPPVLEPGFFPRTIEDETNYSSGDPWPVTTDGNSLNRLASLRPGDDPAGWNARAPNPGRVFNAPPTAVADTVHLPVTAGVVTIDVLANDLDEDNDTLSIVGTTDGAFGTVQTDGSVVTFTPGAAYNGNDTFTYTISDGAGGSAVGTVTLRNTEPTAMNDAFHPATNGGAIVLDVLANDADPEGDPLTVTAVGAATTGTTATDGATVTFTPGPLFTGNDTFTYTVSDGAGGSAAGIVTFGNAAPAPLNDAYHPVVTGGPIVLDVLVNDSDPDGDLLTVFEAGAATTGATGTDGATVSFTPGPSFNGNDTFSYTVADGFGGTASASVALTNALPNAQDDFASSDGTAVTVSVLANDNDADLDPLAIASVTTPSSGTAEVSGTDIVYTPGAGFSGDDAFSYVVSDGHGGAASANVIVRAVNVVVKTEAQTNGAVPGMPGATFGSLETPAIGNDGSLSWLAKVRTAGSSKLTKAIFGGLNPELLFLKGNPVPGIAGASFKKFSDPVNDGAGGTIFVGTFKGSGVKKKKDDSAIFAATESGVASVIARTGDPAPEFPGAAFKAFTAVDADGGETLYAAKLKGTRDNGVWAWDGATSRLVLRSGTAVDTPAGPRVVKSHSVLPSVKGSSGQGRSHRAGEVALHLSFSDKTEGLALASFDGTAWTTEVIALSGQSTDAGVCSSFGIPALSTPGDFAALCTLAGAPKTSDEVIVSFVDGVANAVARKGEPSPVPGTFFDSFDDPVANAEGTVAFTAKLSGGAVGKKNDGAIFQYDSVGNPVVIAREEQAAVSAPGASWKKFTSLALPSWPGAGPVFLAALRGGSVNKKNDLGLWAQTTDGQLILLARTGEAIASGGSTRILAKMALLNGLPPVQGSGRSYNDRQRIAFLATFTDGSEAIQVIRVP